MTRPKPGAFLTPRDLQVGMLVRHHGHQRAGVGTVEHIDKGRLPWVVVFRRTRDGVVVDLPSRPDSATRYTYVGQE